MFVMNFSNSQKSVVMRIERPVSKGGTARVAAFPLLLIENSPEWLAHFKFDSNCFDSTPTSRSCALRLDGQGMVDWTVHWMVGSALDMSFSGLEAVWSLFND